MFLIIQKIKLKVFIHWREKNMIFQSILVEMGYHDKTFNTFFYQTTENSLTRRAGWNILNAVRLLYHVLCIPGLGSRNEPHAFGLMEPEPLDIKTRSRSRYQQKTHKKILCGSYRLKA